MAVFSGVLRPPLPPPGAAHAHKPLSYSLTMLQLRSVTTYLGGTEV